MVKTRDPIRVVVVGESAMSTMPPARARGTVPRCSQPRSLGLMSARVSLTASFTDSQAWLTASLTWLPGPLLMGRRYPQGCTTGRNGDDDHPIVGRTVSTIVGWRTGSVAF